MSLINRWELWYRDLDKPEPYGDVTTYHLAKEFLDDCQVVEDWGSGKGYFSHVFGSRCIGVDGTATPFTEVVADLTDYHSRAEGVLLRHVLEHNERWADILINAVATMTRKLCIILFTPCGDVTKRIGYSEDLQVPDISFALHDLFGHMKGMTIYVERLSTITQYGEETIIRGTV